MQHGDVRSPSRRVIRVEDVAVDGELVRVPVSAQEVEDSAEAEGGGAAGFGWADWQGSLEGR